MEKMKNWIQSWIKREKKRTMKINKDGAHGPQELENTVQKKKKQWNFTIFFQPMLF